jgi:transposase
LVERFRRIVHDHDPAALPAWINNAAGSVLASSAKTSSQSAAIAAQMTEPWSQGQPEGQTTKLKLVKRQCMNSKRSVKAPG